MFPTKNIIANAMKPRDHTTLVAAVKAAGLVETLQGAGPFTVFAPTNAAFGKLPSGTVDMLKPRGRFTLFVKRPQGSFFSPTGSPARASAASAARRQTVPRGVRAPGAAAH